MRSGPVITGVEMTTYEFFTDDMGTDRHGFNLVYAPGDKLKQVGAIIQIHTDAGITGEFPIHAPPARTQVAMCAGYLIGKDVTAREQIYNETKRALRQFDMTGVGVIDIILWDIAGKMYNEPLYRLLGGTRRPLAAYASTVHGDENGGLTTPDQFAEFAVRCRDMGYPAFKIHGWGLAGSNVQREIDNILAVRAAVGDRMDLMLDPACELATFGQALAVGRACDEANFFWLEDAYQDGGVATLAHRKLRQLLKTPLLQTEHVRLPEQTINFAIADATDFRSRRRLPGRRGDRSDEDRARRRRTRSGRGATHARPGAPPPDVGDPQHQLLRIGPGPSQRQDQRTAPSRVRGLCRQLGLDRFQRKRVRPRRSRARGDDRLGMGAGPPDRARHAGRGLNA